MKTAITSIGNEINSKFDLRFGRAGWFCIYNRKTGTTEFIENESKDAKGGAGTKAAEVIAELGVTRVVSGDFGPKAKDLLQQLKIQMVIMDEASSSIQQIINSINNH